MGTFASRKSSVMNDPSVPRECDLLIVGGGVNGTAIARDAAGRGLSVVLCERDDLASHTSSASSKLIHGGLRYLEHYEFALVRKALAEREILLQAAPHIMRPLRFVLPHDAGQRPAWMIRLGLFLYDTLAPREMLPGAETVDLAVHAAGASLKPEFRRGFAYSDGWVDDARLVALNAVDAAQRGASILTRTECTGAERGASHWTVALRATDGRMRNVQARALVNAAGPWAAQFLHETLGLPARTLRLVKGSHIVVPRLFEHDFAYLFQHPDGRIVFALPYQRDFTLIGTTDAEFSGDPAGVAIDAEEIAYLCALAGRYFSREVTPVDVVWSYSGVRPLIADGERNAAAATRDYRLELDREKAPLLSVLGGKITTARKLAEEAVDRLAQVLGIGTGAWTARACLPGGDLFGQQPCARAVLEFDGFVQRVQQRWSWLPPALAMRYARAYGTRIELLLGDARRLADLGEEVLPDLYAAEIAYLRRNEWAVTGADILWRRTKLGLHLPHDAEQRLDAWLREHPLAAEHPAQEKTSP